MLKQRGKAVFTAGQFARCLALNETSESGLQIGGTRFKILHQWIPDFRFQKVCFPGFQIPQANISWILESRLLYMARFTKSAIILLLSGLP